VWLGFVYCEIFRLQLPFPDQFRAILLGFIRFRYTGIYRPLSVFDFPVYRFRPKKFIRVKTVRGFFQPLPDVFTLNPTYDRVAKNEGDGTTNIMHEILPPTGVQESQSTARLDSAAEKKLQREIHQTSLLLSSQFPHGRDP
jgi:hypothetical protein